MDVSRRDLLLLLASACAGAASEASAQGPSAARSASEGGGFSPNDLRTLDAILEAVYGPGAAGTDAIPALVESIGYLAPDRQELIALLPAVLDLGSRLFGAHFVAYSALDLSMREAVLDEWATSSLGFRRQVYTGLRQLLLLHAHTDPSTWASVGYPGPLLGRMELPVHPLRFGEP